MANSLYTLILARVCRSWRTNLQILPEHVFTKYCSTPSLYTHRRVSNHRSWVATFRNLPEHVFTKSRSSRNMCLQFREFVYTSAGFFLIIFIMSCRTPSQSVREEGMAHLEQQSKEHENSQLDDTTTITHKRIDSTSTVTQIIRKVIYDKDRSAQSLQDSSYQSSRRVEDTLTPALINTISKGFAVACIGLGLMMLGFLVVVVILIFRLSKGT